MKPDKLYQAKQIMWYDDFPYNKIRIKEVFNNLVTYATEWPVREITVPITEFNKLFEEWV